MKLQKKILHNLQPGEVSEVQAPASTSRTRARLRALNHREDNWRPAGDGDLNARLAALGLADDPAWGRPAWHPQRGRLAISAPAADADDWDQWALELDRAEQLDSERELLAGLQAKHGLTGVTPARLRELEQAAAERDALPAPERFLPPYASPTPVPAPIPAPPPAPRLPMAFTVTQRTPGGRIARVETADGLVLRITGRDGNGRIRGATITQADGAGRARTIRVEGPK